MACYGIHAVPDDKSAAGKKKSGNANDLKRLEKLINDLAIEHIPHQYEKKKDWGKQKERWDGLHIQLKDFKLKTKRRKKMVNHGTWKKYSASLVDPNNRLRFHLNSINKNSKGQAVVNVSVEADLNLSGRISEWVKGVQLFSISAEGKASVRLDVVLTLGTRLDLKNLPPDLYLEPVVNSANLTVKEFRIKRISKLGGEVAQQVGRSVRKTLDDKIEEYETKLVTKMNRSISKKKGDLKLSVAELVDSEWSKFEKYLIPEDENTDKESNPSSAAKQKPSPIKLP